jgi:hypothetical protein
MPQRRRQRKQPRQRQQMKRRPPQQMMFMKQRQRQRPARTRLLVASSKLFHLAVQSVAIFLAHFIFTSLDAKFAAPLETQKLLCFHARRSRRPELVLVGH